MNKLVRELAEKSNLAIHTVGFGTSTIQNEAEIDKFIELLLKECYEAVISCDESPKLIVHEPYRGILSSIDERFGPDEENEPT